MTTMEGFADRRSGKRIRRTPRNFVRELWNAYRSRARLRRDVARLRGTSDAALEDIGLGRSQFLAEVYVQGAGDRRDP